VVPRAGLDAVVKRKIPSPPPPGNGNLKLFIYLYFFLSILFFLFLHQEPLLSSAGAMVRSMLQLYEHGLESMFRNCIYKTCNHFVTSNNIILKSNKNRKAFFTVGRSK
jgi:hypothetical protein